MLRTASVVGAIVLLSILTGESEAIESILKPPKKPVYTYETKWFTQQVDHFSFSNNDVFQQRYLINSTYWDSKAEGPIFFYTGNEGTIESFAENSGFMWDIAPDFGALLIFAEHRYYGKSLPYGANSTSNNAKYVGYLTSEQALADYAEMLISLKQTIKGAEKSPVIAFGGSYGGMLAAWFRIKFPHVCDGAIAASAPVAQFSAPCDAFARIVTADYKNQHESCADYIRRSWSVFDNYTSSDAGIKWLNDNYKSCKPLKKGDGPVIKGYLNELWTNVAMMDYPYPTDFLAPLPGNPVDDICYKMGKFDPVGVEKSNETLLQAIYQGASVYFNYTGNTTCLDINHPDDIGADMWDYQACTEMVMPMCSDGINDMFEPQPWNYTAFADDCYKRWKVKPRKDMADLMYGQKKLKGASNIIFSNGLLDPWSSGGILKTMNPSVVAVIIPEGAHHLDLRGANENDPVSVKNARDIEVEHIRKWVKQAQNQSNQGGGYGPDSGDIIPTLGVVV